METTELVRALEARTAAGDLLQRDADGGMRCTACAHRCVLTEGRAGACGVRFRRGDALRVPFGYVARRYVRPIETNTIYHVRPGAPALTFGMYGCDLRCPYCHNWRISQALREGTAGESPTDITPEALVAEALAAGCAAVVGAYNEPMITAEWARAIFTEARRHDLVTALVSDGNSTPEALAYMRPVTDVFRVDLKGWSAAQYRVLGGRAETPLACLREARRLGYWVEAVTLVVPGFNDEADGLRQLAGELAAIDPDLPWHLNGFQPRFKMSDRPRTDAMTLVSAAGAAYALGLRHVYVGNLADEVRQLSHTRCPACRRVLVKRANYETLRCDVRDGACPDCGTLVAGLW